jgi:hypothetical protein
MCALRDFLWLSIWLLQIPIVWIAWLIFRGRPAYRGLWQIPILFFGSVLFTIVAGIVLVVIAQRELFRIALFATSGNWFSAALMHGLHPLAPALAYINFPFLGATPG